MPKRPEDRVTGSGSRGLIQAGCGIASGLALLAGCATTATPGPDSESAGPAPVLQQVASRLPGDYASVQRQDHEPQILTISRQPGTESRSLELAMVQAAADGANTRRYGLRLEPGSLEHRLEGQFALLDGQGRSRRSCPMTFHVSEVGLVGETDPASCRFGDAGSSVGLLKEIAFDGRELTIGDRLIDPESGEALGPDQIIRFLPVRRYEGWLGVREGTEWRVARDFELRTGASTEPLDAAEMSLGIAVALNYYRMQRGETKTLMRLTVTDLRSGDLVAESWAAPGSGSIGLALPDLQVGLRLPE